MAESDLAAISSVYVIVQRVDEIFSIRATEAASGVSPQFWTVSSCFGDCCCECRRCCGSSLVVWPDPAALLEAPQWLRRRDLAATRRLVGRWGRPEVVGRPGLGLSPSSPPHPRPRPLKEETLVPPAPEGPGFGG